MTRSSAHLFLLAAAAFWGFGNIAQKTVLNHIGPLSATCLRCAIASVAVLPLVWMERRWGGRKAGFLISSLLVAASFSIAIFLQQTAYLSSTVTNASFLVNTATVLTPFLAWLLLAEVTGWQGIVAALITLLGVFLMATDGFALFGLGDLLCLGSAVFYALWMVALRRHAHLHGNPYITAFAQFSFAAVATFVPTLLLERTTLTAVTSAGPELVVLGLVSTAAAFCLQTVAQGYTTASAAAVLVSGESIFGALGAYVVLSERPTASTVSGAVLIFLAILLVSVFTPIAASGSVQKYET